MGQEFWVVGGNFRDVTFDALGSESGELHGPFESYGAALTCWRERTAETRSCATTRFTVVSTAPNPSSP